MFMLNGEPLGIDSPFATSDGTQYPANWLRLATEEEKQAIGITEIPDPQPYDDRFYWGPNNPKDLNDLKNAFVTQMKSQANTMMAPTDWMIIRKIERNIDVPAEVTTFRQAVVAECTRLTDDINAASTVEGLISVLQAQNWPK